MEYLEKARVSQETLQHVYMSGCISLTEADLTVINDASLIDLKLDGCTALDSLYIENMTIGELNLHGCTALEWLDWSGSKLGSVDLSECTSLKNVDFHSNEFESLNVSGCTSLQTLDLSGCLALERLQCYGSLLGSIDLSDCTSLQFIDCQDNQLTSLDITGCSNLERIYCCHNMLTTLDCSGLGKLYYLCCNHNMLENIDIDDCTKLEYLACAHNKINKLDLSDSLLAALLCNNNELTELNIVNGDNIELIACFGNHIDTIDLSAFPNLRECYESSPMNITYFCDEEECSHSRVADWDYYFEDNTVNGYGLSYIVDCYPSTYYCCYLFCDASTKPVGRTITPSPTITVTPVPTAANTPAPTSTSTPTPTVTVTPIPTATNTPTPTATPAATSSPTPPANSGIDDSSSPENQGVSGFIERLYIVALHRGSDPHGKKDWLIQVRIEGLSGADLARGFLFSDEFINSQMSDSAFIDVLYKTFFNRAPDAQKSHWLMLMQMGWSRRQVIDGFINSTEWANLCLTYGIVSGTSYKPNITVKPSREVVSFTTRIYLTCLGRPFDLTGLSEWSFDIANMRVSASAAAHGFFFSTEFISHHYSNEEFVTRLYRTFMDREPDPAGFADWTGRLANGASREDVFQGFAGSVEWAGICADYGILK